jgi:hypothetical protein
MLRDQDLQALNNINYILSHPDQFIDPEKFPLSQIRNDLNADLDTIAAVASNALNHPKEAALPQLKLTGPIELPQRKAGLPPLALVPDVVGKSVDDAHKTLEALGLHADDALVAGAFGSPKNGTVTGQNPAAGTMVNPGSTITLTVPSPTVMIHIPF